jgi:hypothetical protein
MNDQTIKEFEQLLKDGHWEHNPMLPERLEQLSLLLADYKRLKLAAAFKVLLPCSGASRD